MIKAKLENIFFNTTKKEGQKYIDKNGNPFTMVAIFYDGGKKASMYCANERDAWKLDKMKQWREGDEVEIEIEQSGNFTNFKIPSKAQVLEDENTVLKAQLEALGAAPKVDVVDVDEVIEDLD